jgi:ABC-type transport system involved in Fe-S cluster assembly fused permease/ATPase subunit
MRIKQKSFAKLHSLDMSYYKSGKRNASTSVFAINRAVNSIETGLRFFLGFFSGMTLEFAFLCLTMAKFCGPLYFINMVATVAAYCKYTQYVGNQRLKLI